MSAEYLRRSCFLALFAYVYGEPNDNSRLFKTSLIGLTDAEMPLDFEVSIGDQVRAYKQVKSGATFNDYYNALLSVVLGDEFYDTLFLEANFQNKLGGECYIFRRGSDKYIVFRGSDEINDIWIDLTIQSVPLLIGKVLIDETIRVHKGFLEQLKNYNFIQQIMKSVKAEECSQIYIIGHSLGSASGLIQGYYMHHALKHLDIGISIVSVGGPVVGTSSWIKSFNDIFCSGNKKRRFDRLINERDIIPNLHTYALGVLDTFPLVKRISAVLEPPTSEYDCRLAKYINKYTFEYGHVGFETWIIRKEQFDMMGDTWTADKSELVRVVNAKHSFVEPTNTDVVNIASGHMLEYQQWLSGNLRLAEPFSSSVREP
jgi:hypothetical protein